MFKELHIQTFVMDRWTGQKYYVYP